MGTLVPVALALLMLQAASGPEGNGPSGEVQQQNTGQQQAAAPSKPAASASWLEELLSIEHIRKELERAPTLTFTMPDPNAPRYRIEIRGYRFYLPDWQARLMIPPSPVPTPLGGIDHYEMMRVITPPQYWGSAPFTSGDLLKMSALSGAYGLAGALIKKGIEARYSAAAARAREEVQRELAEIAAHNARVAAGLTDEESKKATKTDKQKRDEEKKQQQSKKKKDGGRGSHAQAQHD